MFSRSLPTRVLSIADHYYTCHVAAKAFLQTVLSGVRFATRIILRCSDVSCFRFFSLHFSMLEQPEGKHNHASQPAQWVCRGFIASSKKSLCLATRVAFSSSSFFLFFAAYATRQWRLVRTQLHDAFYTDHSAYRMRAPEASLRQVAWFLFVLWLVFFRCRPETALWPIAASVISRRTIRAACFYLSLFC